MLIGLILVAVAVGQDVQVFATLGHGSSNNVVSDCGSSCGPTSGFSAGAGIAYTVHADEFPWMVMPKLDVRHVTGETPASEAQLALLFGVSWEHVLAGVGPCGAIVWSRGDEQHAAGVSFDIAAILRPFVAGFYLDRLATEVKGTHLGVRVGVIF